MIPPRLYLHFAHIHLLIARIAHNWHLSSSFSLLPVDKLTKFDLIIWRVIPTPRGAINSDQPKAQILSHKTFCKIKYSLFQAPRQQGKHIEKSYASTARELGRDGQVNPVSTVFGTSFPSGHSAPGILYEWSILTVDVNHINRDFKIQ